MLIFVRVFVDANGPIAEVRVLVRGVEGSTSSWQWDLPYLLWSYWGTGRTVSWLGEQYRRHDNSTFEALGSRVLLSALRRALYQHEQQRPNAWLSPNPPLL